MKTKPSAPTDNAQKQCSILVIDLTYVALQYVLLVGLNFCWSPRKRFQIKEAHKQKNNQSHGWEGGFFLGLKVRPTVRS
jgi:hypothetical protein